MYTLGHSGASAHSPTLELKTAIVHEAFRGTSGDERDLLFF